MLSTFPTNTPSRLTSSFSRIAGSNIYRLILSAVVKILVLSLILQPSLTAALQGDYSSFSVPLMGLS